MDRFRPVGLRLADQPDDVIGIVPVHETPEKIVFTRHFQRGVAPLLGRFGEPVQVFPQRVRNHFVRIEHEHPLVFGLRNRIIASRLDDARALVVNDPAAVFLGNGDRAVGAVHIAQYDFVERFDRAQALVQKAQEKAAKDAGFVTDLYDSVQSYTVTNMGNDIFAKLLAASQNGITDTETVPGEGTQGKNFDEYHVDEDALSDLIISMFYEKI